MPTFFSEICIRLKCACRIIAAPLAAALLASLLAGCSTVKLAYNNAPELAYWWLDGYLDFDASQTPRVRGELDWLLAWHRQNELPQWIALLQKAQAMAPNDSTPAQACELAQAMRLRLLALAEQAEPAGAVLALTLTRAQLDHLQKKYAQVNDDYRADWIDKSREAQQDRRYEQWLNRSEDFYGNLDERQKKALRQMVADSVFNPVLFDAERKRRQTVALRTLRTLGALGAEPGVSASEAQQVLHAYIRTVAEPPPGRWRDQQEALWQESCRNVAALHNMTTPAQREQAVRRLRSYETQLRELAAAS
ncbi:DUF6279 family lipoprotein [Variovorax soli]|uniref:DUF6279 family lipoprotein n=1 Tax=Variovorax soli TaxID=376815 RepID=UPI000AC5C713|nr:DUF6279 family lipoprotein [Variovorax soli]